MFERDRRGSRLVGRLPADGYLVEPIEDISQLLAHRRLELDAAREHLNEETKRRRLAATQRDLLSLIRKFLRLR